MPLAVGKAINDRFGLYFEPYGELMLREVHVASFDAGLTLLPAINGSGTSATAQA